MIESIRTGRGTWFIGLALTTLIACAGPEVSPAPTASVTPDELSPTAAVPSNAAPSPGATAQALPAPELSYVGRRNFRSQGTRYTAFEFSISNWSAYPAELFSAADDLPECPNSEQPSRLALSLRDSSTGLGLLVLCSLGQSGDLGSLELVLPRGEQPPASVYAELIDRTTQAVAVSHSVQLQAVAPATPSATPATATPAPVLGPARPRRVARRFYDHIALAADSAGSAHVAAGTTNGIVHLTNASGSWERERITSALADGFDGDPSITVDTDGTVHLAFTRYATWFCFGIGCVPQDPQEILVMTLGPDGWSQPSSVAGSRSSRPSLVVRDGRIHLAYERAHRSGALRVLYASGPLGKLVTDTVVDSGYSPMLRVASDGTARVAFHEGDSDEPHYATATTATGSFTVEAGPDGLEAKFDLDADDRPHFVGDAGYVTRYGGDWTTALSIFPPGPDEDIRPGGIEVGADGTIHVISENNFSSGNGVWYARLENGSFQASPLYETDGFIEDGPPGSAVFATDATGRVHVAFTVLSESDRGLWYGRPDD